MAETDAVINIHAEGADAASAAIGSVTSSMKGVAGQSEALKGKFQERFQHLGLQLFAQDALRANGLGREAREVMNLLNMAISAGGAVAGISSGGIMLLVAALGALVGVAMKVHEHFQKLHVDLQKQIDLDEKAIDKTNELLSPMEEYRKKVGELPAYLQELYNAKKKLHDFMIADEIMALKLQNIELEKTITTQAKSARDYSSFAMEGVTMTDKKTRAMHDNTVELLKNQSQLAENNAKLKLFTMGQDDLKKTITETTAAIESEKKAMEKESEALTKEYQEMAEKREKLILDEADRETKEFQRLGEEHQKKLDAQYGSETRYHKEIRDLAEKTQHDIGQSFGNAFAQMLVEGRSFTEGLTQAFKQMAMQIIADLIRIQIQAAITRTISGGLLSVSFGGGHAAGGSTIVNQPTTFLAGEGGEPELATFTPLSKMGKNGSSSSNVSTGGSSVTIGTVETNVYGVQDPDAIADQVGRKIIERVRGQGELNFVRVS